MKQLLAGLVLLLAFSGITQAEPGPDSRIRMALAQLEHIQDDLFFIGYQSIPAAAGDGHSYMLLDFRFEGPVPGEKDLYASIDRICRTVLANRNLVSDLSRAGYDMVSVAFDERSQYDCLP
ncbi:hypothetical protein AAIA72_13690 [Hahella sp. SMD15-11]|uniref:Uncharacterized protein n=1 Tax=Thermohahella caldifontis TaxID=3142973 RepID=A0AB39UUA0_9GAMM